MYQALYRKWRPSQFDDVYGQPHITKTLKNELETGRISHAYLFTGTRGTGKTTCAKILAKAVNCLHPVNGNPCNECEICKGIDNGSILDVIEIDAASNNKVEDVRDIREEVNFTPANCRYRVYIIDEVHMLSTAAFNALLKTLEEPPAHVIFILATTDLHKLPETILSRCQRFDFKRIAPEDIVARLNFVAEKEGVTITEEAAHLIANIADGGMRDSLSLMDRCLSISDNIDEQTVSDAAGTAGTRYLFEFSEFISKGMFREALLLINKLHNESCDIESLCTGLTSHFRNLMVAKTVNDCNGLIICSKDEMSKYKQRAEELKLTKILQCIEVLCETSKIIKSAANKKIQLEAAVIKMCGFTNNESYNPAPAPSQAPSYNMAEPQKQSSSQPQSQTPAPVQVNVPEGNFSMWPEVLEKLMKINMPLFGLLDGTTATVKENKLIVNTSNSSLYDFIIKNDNCRIDLLRSIYEITGQKMKLSVFCTEKQENTQKAKSPLEGLMNKVNEFNNNTGEN